MTSNLSLILYTTRIQKQFPLSVFVFIDSLVVSALQTASGYVISRQNNLELHLGCHNCWLSYFTLVWLLLLYWTYGHVIAKISRTGRLPHFLTHCAPLQILYPALIFTKNNCFPWLKTSSYCYMLNKQSLPRLLIACLRPVALCFLRMGVFCIIFYKN